MRISSFHINKFCGAYTNPYAQGGYYNPRNIDFKTSIKKIVDSLLNEKDDIVFLQEFCNNKYVRVEELFSADRYTIFSNTKFEDLKKIKSHVVAITLNNSFWEKIVPATDINYQNRFMDMKMNNEKMNNEFKVLSFHNSNSQGKKDIEDLVEKHLSEEDRDIILGDFNDTNWIKSLTSDKNRSSYRDLVTNDMVTYKPAQTTIDRIFVKTEYEGKIVFNGVMETYASDHNILTFLLNI